MKAELQAPSEWVNQGMKRPQLETVEPLPKAEEFMLTVNAVEVAQAAAAMVLVWGLIIAAFLF